MVYCIYLGVSGYDLKHIVFFFLNMFTFMNSVDPGEMLHNAAFHLGLDCLWK